MAKHYPMIDDVHSIKQLSDQSNHAHILLIRDPKKVVASWNQAVQKGNTQSDAFIMDEIGIDQMEKIYSELNGNVIVVDSDQLVSSPEPTMRLLFDKLQIDFDEKMMHWEAGPKSFDGVWVSSHEI